MTTATQTIEPVWLCAWCPDSEAEQARILADDPVAEISHGICDDCRGRIDDDLAALRVREIRRARPRPATVEQHPAGGWTHGIPSGPGLTIFSGWYPTQSAARAALQA